MRLSVACNFDDALLEGLRGYPVHEIYGKVTSDHAGGGRPSFYLPRANRKTVERFARKARSMGIAFNYLMNASCMSNTEYTREGQRRMGVALARGDNIEEARIKAITASGEVQIKL